MSDNPLLKPIFKYPPTIFLALGLVVALITSINIAFFENINNKFLCFFLLLFLSLAFLTETISFLLTGYSNIPRGSTMTRKQNPRLYFINTVLYALFGSFFLTLSIACLFK